jgi:2-phosphoglycolate phosphatase
MPLRAVLFDFDGTLADSYAAITASVNHVRNSHNLPPLSVDGIRPHVGRGLPYLLQQCVPGTDVAADSRLYRNHHPSVMESGTVLLPGAADTLRELHRRSLALAICSNKPKPFTQSLVKVLGIAPFLAAVFGPEDVARLKPAPDMLIHAIHTLGVAAEDSLYVGDMTVDIETGRGAGVCVWVVPTGSDTRESLQAAKPDRIVASLAELLAELPR